MPHSKQDIVKFLVNYNAKRFVNRSNPYKGFLTEEEAQVHLSQRRCVIAHSCRLNDVEYCFFSDDHLYGYQDERNKLNFVPSTSYLPMDVVWTPELKKDVIETIDDYLIIFVKRKEINFIETFDELVEVIQKHDLVDMEAVFELSVTPS